MKQAGFVASWQEPATFFVEKISKMQTTKEIIALILACSIGAFIFFLGIGALLWLIKDRKKSEKKPEFFNDYIKTIQGFDTRLQIYIDRLYKEWTTHGKIIIGVDFDTTISPYGIENGSDISRTISVLKFAMQTGCYIVIHTSCKADRHQEIRNYCKEIGLKVDTINQTPIDLPYGKEGSKPYCNHFLDDRAGLPASLDILEVAMYKVRGDQQSKIVELYLQ